MAQYKVPQDVEADDKLLGPFTFRQFIYLIITCGLIALAWALFQAFPLLALIPLPIVFFFGALALPIKKDQPMETYFAALLSFYLKPRKRLWEAGQPESTVYITAPKKSTVIPTKNISRDEATHRLSFLADIVDSEGHAIKGALASPLREEIYAEANTTLDIFENPSSASAHIEQVIQDNSNSKHTELVQQMRNAIDQSEAGRNLDTPSINKFENLSPSPGITPSLQQTSVAIPLPPQTTNSIPNQNSVIIDPSKAPESTPIPKQNLVDLANNTEFSIETIAKEAKRLETKHNEEVYISLH